MRILNSFHEKGRAGTTRVPRLTVGSLGLAAVMLLASCGPASSGNEDDTQATPTPEVTPTPTPVPTPTPDPFENPGKLGLTFAMDTDWMDYMEAHGEQAIGPFESSIYFADDVSGIGPAPGAEELDYPYVTEVDLVHSAVRGGPTDVLFTTVELPSVRVCVLGFLDSDHNAGDSDSPDEGDPVTLPGQNCFQVVAGQTTTVKVYFGMLNP